jgi:hypothetical protein
VPKAEITMLAKKHLGDDKKMVSTLSPIFILCFDRLCPLENWMSEKFGHFKPNIIISRK